MELLLKYFKNLDLGQVQQLEKIQGLYKVWNRKINVISRNDIQHLYERHVLHSLAIARFFNFMPNQSILDVGTGGGFPGIPLAILFPDTRFHLIDSIGKKIKVVNVVAEALGLENVKAEHKRVQDLDEKYDYVISRAVTNLPDFVNMSQRVLKTKQKDKKKNGILYLKGGDFMDELKRIGMGYQIYELSETFEENFSRPKNLFTFLQKDNGLELI